MRDEFRFIPFFMPGPVDSSFKNTLKIVTFANCFLATNIEKEKNCYLFL